MITRKQLMTLLRGDEISELLTVDDRCEIFQTILTGSSDITKESLTNLINEYGGEANLVVLEGSEHEELLNKVVKLEKENKELKANF